MSKRRPVPWSQVGKVEKHPYHLAHTTLATPPSKATSLGKVVALKSHLARGEMGHCAGREEGVSTNKDYI